MTLTMLAAQRFWSKVDRTGDCWLWRGTRDGLGYGFFRLGPGKMRRAHRIAWEEVVGPIPLGLCLLHACDTPACVRPAHLRLGTRDENNADRNRKGRQAHGEQNGRALLSGGQVIAIRERRRLGHMAKDIAADYGVAAETVTSICQRRSWRHL